MMRLVLALVLLAQEGAKPPEGATVLDAAQFVNEKDGAACAWTSADGILTAGKGSVMTKEKYQDFQLHVEFNIPQPPEGAKDQARGNSGIYIQRRYEVQILDSSGEPPTPNGCGSLYKQKAPDKNMCRKPGEWQVYDITFRAARFGADGKKTENARITVVWNGETVHKDAELKDKTGAGKPEAAEPGPILLQDHGAPVKFRNLWILAKK